MDEYIRYIRLWERFVAGECITIDELGEPPSDEAIRNNESIISIDLVYNLIKNAIESNPNGCRYYTHDEMMNRDFDIINFKN